MKRLVLIFALVAAFLGPRAARPASGDWNVFVSASAINRIVCLGDSIWCATRGGILIFDLADSSFTQHLDGLGFRSTDVSGVARDSRGSVWASFTTTGVARIDRLGRNASVQVYSATKDGLLSDSVTCIVSAGDDVYYGSTNGAAKFYDNFHSFEPNLSDSLRGIRVNDLLVRGDTLWVACRKGVALFQRSILSFRMFRIGSVSSLCVHDGAVCCADSAGVHRFNGSTWVSLGLPQTVDSYGHVTYYVPLAVASGGGNLYCLTDGKVFLRSGSEWTDITGNLRTMFSRTYLIGDTKTPLRTITVDPRGTPWIAGFELIYNRGTYLSAYVNGFWTNKAPAQLSQNGIVSLALGPDHGIWASTRYFGISFRSDEDRWTSYTKLRTPTDGAGLSYFLNNLALLYDSQGYLWCNALNYDLDRIKINDPLDRGDDEWTHYTLGAGTITSNRFVKAKEDPAGNRWFLSDDDYRDRGIYGINIVSADGAHWLSVNPTTESRMAGGSVFDCVFGSDGTVYLALRGYGVQEWRTGGYDWAHLSNLAEDSWYTIIRPDNLASTDLYAVEHGSDGSVWLGTASGLVRYKSGVIDSIIVKKNPGERGLLGAVVYDLEFDGAGNLWVGTDQGLNRIDPKGTIDAFTTFDAWKGDLYPASVISPLPSSVCVALRYDAGVNALWIGTTNGIARLDVSLLAEGGGALSRMILYPNPVHISRGDKEVRIARISGPVSIRVYTLEGELVHEADGVAEGAVAWDLLTLNGFKARSGIYIVRVSSGNSSAVRKIGIIR